MWISNNCFQFELDTRQPVAVKHDRHIRQMITVVVERSGQSPGEHPREWPGTPLGTYSTLDFQFSFVKLLHLHLCSKCSKDFFFLLCGSTEQACSMVVSLPKVKFRTLLATIYEHFCPPPPEKILGEPLSKPEILKYRFPCSSRKRDSFPDLLTLKLKMNYFFTVLPACQSFSLPPVFFFPNRGLVRGLPRCLCCR